MPSRFPRPGYTRAQKRSCRAILPIETWKPPYGLGAHQCCLLPFHAGLHECWCECTFDEIGLVNSDDFQNAHLRDVYMRNVFGEKT
jgi:hypothetical protein